MQLRYTEDRESEHAYPQVGLYMVIPMPTVPCLHAETVSPANQNTGQGGELRVHFCQWIE